MNARAGIALAAGLAALLAWGLALARAPAQAWAAWLAACVFCLGLSLGATGLLLILTLAGGSWDSALRPSLRAAAGALPLLAVLFLPLLPALPRLYPWLQAAALEHSEVLRQQAGYLNEPLFLARTALCFAVWLWLARCLRTASPSRAFGAAGALLMLPTVTVFAVDWIMSLQPAFASSSFGLVVGVSQLLGAAALAALAAGHRLGPRAATDFGGVLLMLVLGWTYLEFMSYLTVWTGDLPPEVAWYQPRTQGGWKWLALAMLLLQALLPFFLLLSGRVRRSRCLPLLACGILLGNAAEAAWRVLPALHPQGLRYGWSEAVALVGIGGLWLAMFLRRGAGAHV